MRKILLALCFVFVMSIASNCFAAAATMYVTPAGAGTKDGLTWANAFGLGEWETDAEGSAEAGDIYYVAGGTYTLSAAFDASLKDGTYTTPISIIGVKSGTTNEGANIVLSDWAYADDRPLIAIGGNDFRFGDYWKIYNLRMTSTGNGVRTELYCVYYNCKIDSVSRGFYCAVDGTSLILCEATASSGDGAYVGGYAVVLGCYFHDCSDAGYEAIGTRNNLFGNVFDTCAKGYIAGGRYDCNLIGNTFYNCTTGISETTGHRYKIINNIFDECTAPANWVTTNQGSNYFDYNSWDGDASGNTNVTVGLHSIDSDITLTDPANGDFTLPDSSAAEGVGCQVNTDTGVVGDYNWNIGADQTDTQAGGGAAGGQGATWFIQ